MTNTNVVFAKTKQMLATLSDQTITRVGERNRRKYGEGADESILRIITKDLGLAVAEVQRGRILPTHQTLSYVERRTKEYILVIERDSTGHRLTKM